MHPLKAGGNVKGGKMMTNVKNSVKDRTSFIGNILDMLVILIFPFFGTSEIGENRPAYL